MGGVLRTQKALKIFKEGQQDPQKIFWNGNMIWDKPIPGVYPIKEMSTTDNILFVGSSDIGGLTFSNWSPRDHDWPNVFRNNYTGNMFSQINGRPRYGMKSAMTFGRVTLTEILQRSENGEYGDANPLTNMDDFNALCIDTSDIMLGDFRSEYNYPDAPDYYAVTQMPSPFQWAWQEGRQVWLNEELETRMVFIREARRVGIDKFYFTVPWPRLPINNHWASEAELETWINTKFQNFEDSIHYQQDRLIFQMEFEQLGGHVNIIPFHLMVKQTYTDWANNNLPFELASIQNLWANHDNLSTVDPVTGTLPRHWYMLNYYGTYAMNALWAACVYGIDPRGYPATDGFFTLPTAAATYFQNLAWELAHTYARAGRTREYTGYVMPKIRNWTPEQILGSDLVQHFEGALTNGQTSNFTASQAAHVMYVLDVDTAVLENPDFMGSMGLAGSGYDGAFLAINPNMSGPNNGTLNFRSYLDQSGFSEVQVNGMQIVDHPTGVVRIYLDAVYPYVGVNDNLNTNTTLNVYNPLESWKDNRFCYSFGQTTTTRSPILNRLTVLMPGITIREAIVSSGLIPDDKRFNLYRYLSRKYQVDLWEPLWPDMEV